MRWLIALIFCLPVFSFAQTSDWQTLGNGLELRSFKVDSYTPMGDSTITVLRIDPARWEIKLLSCARFGQEAMTARTWSDRYNLIAVINAGMFNDDDRTHTGYMKVDGRHNNRGHNQYRSLATFRPSQPGLAEFHIFDLDSHRIDSITRDYRDVVQNLRLIDRLGSNRWEPQEKRWSEAALGEDRQGRALFIFCRSPYTMYELNQRLLSLPIDLVCAQHLEGGPEAQLFVRIGSTELELIGGYESGFAELDENSHAEPIPNIIGISRKP
jgi:hypothetical protein